MAAKLGASARLSAPATKMILFQRKFALLSGAALIVLVAFLLDPSNSATSLAEGKKVKKVIKSAVKGLILQNLTTRKNFLPLPVPIPGKWQQILNMIVDSGVLELEQTTTGSKKHAVEDSASGISKASKRKQFWSSMYQVGKSLTSRRGDPANVNKKSSDIAQVKKLTRLAAAKYARQILQQQVPSTSPMAISNTKETTLGLVHKALPNLSSSASSAGSSIVDKSPSKAAETAAAGASSSRSARNDVLVTAFNVLKLAQQIRHLEPTKLLNIQKKTSNLAGSSVSGQRIPVLSLNINNKKTFLNKMHYIHKLTYDLHHRHRNNQHWLDFLE